ncbi:putative esterase [Mycobacterium xenopi 4042]|uniref:Putative esterase n=1 Tax=Mycobacterium xenopi 4042 TaxID=1299334 RepID=X8DKY2_MYCXE|nr:putative esterase [Mycobacterium xenopi 4042]
MDTSRVAFLGWSMGGYGALLLGARLGPARTAGICAVSPALWTSYTASTPGIRQLRGLGSKLGVGPARIGIDPDPRRLRHQRPILPGHSAIRRTAADTTIRWLLTGRA